MSVACVHFIGFRGEEYWSAAKVFGPPDVIHRQWDRRALREIGPEDVLVFAKGDEHQPFSRNADDIDETWLLPRLP